MKKYIKASTEYLDGSYLLDRAGTLHSTILHAPSTTFINRGLMFLSPTDADLLLKLSKISEEDVKIILGYNLKYFIEHEKHSSSKLLYIAEFIDWAELKYAPTIRSRFMEFVSDDFDDSDVTKQFETLSSIWYKWLQDNFVKVSVINNVAEFRITSEDGYDWNDVIIDDVILSYDWKPNTKFSILKENDSGYRAYFYNVSLDDILENDTIILSSEYVDRPIT